MKREKITVPVTLLNADVTQMSGKDRLKARSEGLFYITEGDQIKPFAAEVGLVCHFAQKSVLFMVRRIRKECEWIRNARRVGAEGAQCSHAGWRSFTGGTHLLDNGGSWRVRLVD